MADADATDRHRDDVLVAFHAACPRPTAGDVEAWVGRHPDLADDVREHAEAVLASVQDRHLRPEPSPALLARTRSAALEVLASARARARAHAPGGDLDALLAAAGSDIPRLARALRLGRAPVVDLFQGRVALPAPVALLAALADALRTTFAVVDEATRAAPPNVGPAGAATTPPAPRRPFAEIVRDDPTMPSADRDLWLGLLED